MNNLFTSGLADTIIAAAGVFVTIAIATVGGIYAIITNTKKYELTEAYRREVLQWYADTVEIMIRIIHLGEREALDTQKTELLSQLSTKIEIGRFYFPNIIAKDGFGNEKPFAYRGHRHLNLDLLYYFYKTVSKESQSARDYAYLWKIEQEFTSMIFKMIEPRKRNKEYAKYTAIAIPEGQTIDDYLDGKMNSKDSQKRNRWQTQKT